MIADFGTSDFFTFSTGVTRDRRSSISSSGRFCGMDLIFFRPFLIDGGFIRIDVVRDERAAGCDFVDGSTSFDDNFLWFCVCASIRVFDRVVI